MNKWISAIDELPEFDGTYLCYFSDGTIETFSFNNGDIGIWGAGTDIVTHWMPLPDPPE